MAQRNPDKLTDDELYADWLRWIERTYHDIISQGWRHKMFRLMRGIYEQNKELQETGGFFVQWAANNYVAAAAMSLRRELDGRQGAENLFHLLCEMQKRPTVISRARFRATWDSKLEHYMADNAFDSYQVVRISGDSERDHIDPSMIGTDLARLRTLDDVLEHVQTTVAHRMPEGSGAPAPTFAEFHGAVDTIRDVFARYYALLTHRILVFFEPTAQYNVFDPFRIAWITDPETFEYDRCRQDPPIRKDGGE